MDPQVVANEPKVLKIKTKAQLKAHLESIEASEGEVQIKLISDFKIAFQTSDFLQGRAIQIFNSIISLKEDDVKSPLTAIVMDFLCGMVEIVGHKICEIESIDRDFFQVGYKMLDTGSAATGICGVTIIGLKMVFCEVKTDDEFFASLKTILAAIKKDNWVQVIEEEIEAHPESRMLISPAGDVESAKKHAPRFGKVLFERFWNTIQKHILCIKDAEVFARLIEEVPEFMELVIEHLTIEIDAEYPESQTTSIITSALVYLLSMHTPLSPSTLVLRPSEEICTLQRENHKKLMTMTKLVEYLEETLLSFKKFRAQDSMITKFMNLTTSLPDFQMTPEMVQAGFQNFITCMTGACMMISLFATNKTYFMDASPVRSMVDKECCDMIVAEYPTLFCSLKQFLEDIHVPWNGPEFMSEMQCTQYIIATLSAGGVPDMVITASGCLSMSMVGLDIIRTYLMTENESFLTEKMANLELTMSDPPQDIVDMLEEQKKMALSEIADAEAKSEELNEQEKLMIAASKEMLEMTDKQMATLVKNEQFLKFADDRVDALKEAGNENFKQENFLHAILMYTEAIHLCHGHDHKQKHILRSNRAECFIRLGKYEVALEDVEAALAISPEHTKSQLRLKVIQEKLDATE
eukprot:TRINITY_DN3383_c0_g3_i1.p1 TRINITY_DN3383_c0_g3~~TRINITY_DN3383_c0_g3_i1.p1  ORF type:complete len:644 (+),score=226.09 TRINITY_DN3383_c0_g3_i1:25-1932(+)